MKNLAKWAARLYPAAWRARYAVELEALLEDVGPGGRDLWDILRGALFMQMRGLSFWKITAGCMLAGVVAAGIWSLTLPDRYVSTAVMRISPAPSAAGDSRNRAVMPNLLQMQQTTLSRSSLASIIQRRNLYSRERNRIPMEDVIEQMRTHDLRIHPANVAGRPVFAVEFANENPAAAQTTVSDIVASLVEQNLQVSLRPGNGVTNIEVLDPASLPLEPAGPNRLRMVVNGLGAGLLLGLVCGAIWSIVRGRQGWSFRRIGSFAAAGMGLGIAIAFLIPDEFVSTAVLRSANGEESRSAVERLLNDDSLAAMVRRHDLFPREVASGKMSVATRKMHESIRVHTVLPQRMSGPNDAFVVSFQYPDRWKAQQVTRDLVTGLTGVAQPATEVVDPANLPQAPVFPNRPVIAMLGTLTGILLGLAATKFRRPRLATI